jgi:hypothetical protein
VRNRGHVQIELMIMIAVAMIGLAFAVPEVMRYWTAKTLTTGGWIKLAVGAAAFLFGAGRLGWTFFAVWRAMKE